MCKAHSKVKHIKQQKYFHHFKGRGYNTQSLLRTRPGFVFVDVTAFRRSKSITKPNFVDISPFTAVL